MCAPSAASTRRCGDRERGTILFTASDEAPVGTALDGVGLQSTERPALQVKWADQPAEAAKFGRKLADAGGRG